jgi:hypothetical protein
MKVVKTTSAPVFLKHWVTLILNSFSASPVEGIAVRLRSPRSNRTKIEDEKGEENHNRREN